MAKLLYESLDSYINESLSSSDERWMQKHSSKDELAKFIGVPDAEDIPMDLINKKITILKTKKNKNKSELKLLQRLVGAQRFFINWLKS